MGTNVHVEIPFPRTDSFNCGFFRQFPATSVGVCTANVGYVPMRILPWILGYALDPDIHCTTPLRASEAAFLPVVMRRPFLVGPRPYSVWKAETISGEASAGVATSGRYIQG
jgi:hypothetical protein